LPSTAVKTFQGLVGMQVRGGGVALTDRLGERDQQHRQGREHPDKGSLGQLEPLEGQRGGDAVDRAANTNLPTSSRV
jgi:hypothetical protein